MHSKLHKHYPSNFQIGTLLITEANNGVLKILLAILLLKKTINQLHVPLLMRSNH